MSGSNHEKDSSRLALRLDFRAYDYFWNLKGRIENSCFWFTESLKEGIDKTETKKLRIWLPSFTVFHVDTILIFFTIYLASALFRISIL